MRERHGGTRRGRQRRRNVAAALCLGVVILDPVTASGAASSGSRAASAPSSSGTARPGAARTGSAVPSPLPQYGAAQNDKGSSQDSAGAAESAPSATSAAPAPASPAPPPMAVSDPLQSSEFAGLPQVGAIFGYSGGSTTTHFCTASVVDSSGGDVIVTAAHCVYDSDSGAYVDDIAFVPGYHDGRQPYGVWTPSKIVVAQQWIDDADPDYDVAFLVVHQPGSGRRLQDAVGADELGISPPYSTLAQAVGYPAATEKPITCTNQLRQFSATQLEFDCADFPGGTSGGPLLTGVDTATGYGTVSGVIGGYEEGGDTPDVSYSVYFTDAVQDLFTQAEAAG
jgi:V8-like Glu-specific endopeptidase